MFTIQFCIICSHRKYLPWCSLLKWIFKYKIIILYSPLTICNFEVQKRYIIQFFYLKVFVLTFFTMFGWNVVYYLNFAIPNKVIIIYLDLNQNQFIICSISQCLYAGIAYNKYDWQHIDKFHINNQLNTHILKWSSVEWGRSVADTIAYRWEYRQSDPTQSTALPCIDCHCSDWQYDTCWGVRTPFVGSVYAVSIEYAHCLWGVGTLCVGSTRTVCREYAHCLWGVRTLFRGNAWIACLITNTKYFHRNVSCNQVRILRIYGSNTIFSETLS